MSACSVRNGSRGTALPRSPQVAVRFHAARAPETGDRIDDVAVAGRPAGSGGIRTAGGLSGGGGAGDPNAAGAGERRVRVVRVARFHGNGCFGRGWLHEVTGEVTRFAAFAALRTAALRMGSLFWTSAGPVGWFVFWAETRDRQSYPLQGLRT